MSFGHLSDLHRDDGFFVPAGAELDRKWDFDGSTHGFENFAEERKIAQQARAATLDDFLGGAAEIDVHGVVAEFLDHAGSFGHDGRVRAEKLRGDGMLVFLKIEIAKRFGGAARDAFGAGELRHQQAAAAESANDATEKRVRHASHGGKHRGGADGQVANLERSWKHALAHGLVQSRPMPDTLARQEVSGYATPCVSVRVLTTGLMFDAPLRFLCLRRGTPGVQCPDSQLQEDNL